MFVIIRQATVGLDDKIGAAIFSGDQIWTLLGGAVELLKQMNAKAALLARHLQHIVPNRIGR